MFTPNSTRKFETRMNAVGANSLDVQEPFEFDF